MGHKITIRVIADDKIRSTAELQKYFILHVPGKLLQIRPDFEAGNPVGNNLSFFIPKRNTEDLDILGTINRLQSLVAGGSFRFRNKTCDDNDPRRYLQALIINPFAHLFFQGSNLIKDIDDLAACIREPQNILLAKIAMWGKDHNIKHHGNAAQKLLQGAIVRGFEDIRQQAETLLYPFYGSSPTGLKTKIFQLPGDICPLRISRHPAQVLHALLEGLLQRPHAGNTVTEHKGNPLVTVEPEKRKNQLIALGQVMGKSAAQSAVQEFHPPTNGTGLGHFGKITFKGPQINLKGPTGIVKTNEFFLELQKFCSGYFFNCDIFKMKAKIMSLGHTCPNLHTE